MDTVLRLSVRRSSSCMRGVCLLSTSHARLTAQRDLLDFHGEDEIRCCSESGSDRLAHELLFEIGAGPFLNGSPEADNLIHEEDVIECPKGYDTQGKRKAGHLLFGLFCPGAGSCDFLAQGELLAQQCDLSLFV